MGKKMAMCLIIVKLLVIQSGAESTKGSPLESYDVAAPFGLPNDKFRLSDDVCHPAPHFTS